MASIQLASTAMAALLLTSCATNRSSKAEFAAAPTILAATRTLVHQPQETDLSQFFGVTLTEPVADAEETSGTTTARFAIPWRIDGAETHWDRSDRLVNSATSAGLEPYFVLTDAMWEGSPFVPGVGPTDLMERYVEEAVSRYAHRGGYWEVGQFGGLGSDSATSYIRLMERVGGTIQRRDPEARVIGAGGGGPLQFYDDVYRLGGRRLIDGISYELSPDRETDTEDVIRRLRRIQQLHGAGSTPLFLVEPQAIKPEAAALVKKHLLAIASGVQRWYHAPSPDGSDRRPRQAYQVMAELLQPAKFVGRAARVEEDSSRADEAEFQIYRNEHSGENFAVAWVRGEGSPLTVRIRSSGAVAVEDLFGASLEEVQPDAEGFVRVRLNQQPVYLRRLQKDVLPLATIRFVPEIVHLAPGTAQVVKLRAFNPANVPLRVDLSRFTTLPAGAPFQIDPQTSSVLVQAGEEVEQDFTITVPVDAPPFSLAHVAYNDDGRYSYQLKVVRSEAYQVRMRAEKLDGRLAVFAQVQNRLDRPASGSIAWEGAESVSRLRSSFSDLRPGQATTHRMVLSPIMGEMAVHASVVDSDGRKGEGTLRIWGQPFLPQKRIVVDGDLSDWVAMHAVTLKPFRKDSDEAPAAEATARAFWSGPHLHLAADVSDLSGLERQGERSSGRNVEVYIGAGDRSEAWESSGSFRIMLDPDVEGEAAAVRLARPHAGASDGEPIEGGRVALVRTPSGFTLEAAIPAAAFGVRPGPGQMIGFNLRIGGSGEGATGRGSDTLVWQEAQEAEVSETISMGAAVLVR